MNNSREILSSGHTSSFISQRVAYYESEEQAMAILDICNDPDTCRQISDSFKSQIDAPIRSINYFESVPDIARRITLKDDGEAKSIMSYIPVPINTATNGCELSLTDLNCYVREIQQRFLATPILDKMPVSQTKDKDRAQFYLEMSMWYRSKARKCLLQIDWFDILHLWKNSDTYRFCPPIIAHSLPSLFNSIQDTLAADKDFDLTRHVIWLDLPEDIVKHVSDLYNSIGAFREKVDSVLMGVNCILNQKTYNAMIFTLEKNK